MVDWFVVSSYNCLKSVLTANVLLIVLPIAAHFSVYYI